MAETKMTKPTMRQFGAYLRVQYSGMVNMFDTRRVCELAGEGLTKEHCLYISEHYGALLKEYQK